MNARAIKASLGQSVVSAKEDRGVIRSIWEEAKRELSQEQDLKLLELEGKKMALKLREMETSAKVAQEIAIARRIEDADEVQIEEFYDTSGSANLGFAMEQQVFSLGVSASGRLVSRRIIRFRGGAISVGAGE